MEQPVTNLKIENENKEGMVLDIARIIYLKNSQLTFYKAEESCIYLSIYHKSADNEDSIIKALEMLPGVVKVEKIETAENKTEDNSLEVVVNGLDSPVLIIDQFKYITRYNPPAKNLLNLPDNAAGNHLHSVIPPDILETVNKSLQEDRTKKNKVQLGDPACNYNLSSIPVLLNNNEKYVLINLVKTGNNSAQLPVENYLKEGKPLSEIIGLLEKEVLTHALKNYQSIRKAAKALGVSHTTVLNKLNKLDDFNIEDVVSHHQEEEEKEKIKSPAGVNPENHRVSAASQLNRPKETQKEQPAKTQKSLQTGENNNSPNRCSNCGAPLKYGSVFCTACFSSHKFD